MRIGIDAGGSLIKIAYTEQNATHFGKFPASQLDAAAKWVNDQTVSDLSITGGKAGVLNQKLKTDAKIVPEFEATVAGVNQLLLEDGHSLDSFILTNVGTGTSIHHINGDQNVRIIGTGVGGGTLMGLSKLLTGLEDYEEITKLGANNLRDRVDLKVHHIYEGTEPPIPGDLTASNFGNVHHLTSEFSNEEFTSAVIGLVAETITVVSLQVARQTNSNAIVFIGSTFTNNPLMKDIVERYTKMYGLQPIILQHGEYSGAVGAMLK